MRIEDAIHDAEIVVLAVPSAHILDVVESLLPHLRLSHVLLDLAKGLAPGSASFQRPSKACSKRTT